MKRIIGGLGIGVGGCLLWMILAFGINMALALLVWNGLGLHTLLGLGTLSVPQALGISIILALIGVDSLLKVIDRS